MCIYISIYIYYTYPSEITAQQLNYLRYPDLLQQTSSNPVG